MGELRAEGFHNEQGIVRIRAQNADRSGSFSFVMNTSDERPYVIQLAGPFRTVPGRIGLICGRRLRSPGGSRRIVARYFSIQAAQVAVAKHIERKRFVVGGTSDLQIDGERDRRTPLFDLERYLDVFQVGFGEGRYLRTGSGA